MGMNGRVHAVLGGLNPNVSNTLVHLVAAPDGIVSRPRPADVVLRQLTEADAGSWAGVVSAAYGQSTAPSTLAQINAGGAIFADVTTWAVFDGSGQLLATVGTGGYRSDPQVLGIRRLAVSPASQGRGVGSWLVGESLRRNPTPSRVELIVKVTRSRALKIYSELGFVLVSDWSAVVQTGQRRLPMARSLALRRARRSMSGTRV